MVDYSPMVVDTDGGTTNKESVFKGSKGLWELLTRKNVNTEFITKDYLKTYKKILMMADAHLIRYQPVGNIKLLAPNFELS